MTSKPIEFFVILDANVWIAERLLQTVMGTALLFALTSGDAAIGLPEVVELEVGHVLTSQAETAVETIRKNAQLLYQISGRKVSHHAPTPAAIKNGIDERWKSLSGVLRRIPFTHEHARAALSRVIAKLPPSGENNEQFRDACIWAAALGSAMESPVHLISNDGAFFEGRDRHRASLSPILKREVADLGVQLHIHSTIGGFLDSTSNRVHKIDECAISEIVLDAIMDTVHALVAREASGFAIAGASPLRIRGYATPRPSTIAISFDGEFDLQRISTSRRNNATEVDLSIGGTCSYEPKNRQVSEIDLVEWTTSMKGSRGGSRWSRSVTLEPDFSNDRLIE